MTGLMLLSLLTCITILFQSETVVADCIDVCFNGIGGSGGFLNSTCAELGIAEECFHNNTTLCPTSNPLSPESLALNLLQDRIRRLNCRMVTSPPATVPPISGHCPQSSSYTPAPVTSAVVFPSVEVSEGCQDRRSDSQKLLQHCSIFLNGNLRPFPAYRDGLQPCNLPGSWILFRHQKLLIEVEGSNYLGGERSTLTKVNITIFPDACNGQRKYSYVAQSFLPLPSAFSGDPTPHNNASSALQLHMSENNTVASILMVYANFTIVVRNMDFMLSVSLQVPGLDSFNSDGLCSGCPRQQFGNFQEEMQRYVSCPNYVNVVRSCFFIPTLLQLNTINNGSYYDACVLTLAQSISEKAATFISSVAEDALALRDDGVVPSRPPISQEIIPALPPKTTPPLSLETTPSSSTDVTTSTSKSVPDYTTFKVVDEYTKPPKTGLPEPKPDDVINHPVLKEELFGTAGTIYLQSQSLLMLLLLLLTVLSCHALS